MPIFARLVSVSPGSKLYLLLFLLDKIYVKCFSKPGKKIITGRGASSSMFSIYCVILCHYLQVLVVMKFWFLWLVINASIWQINRKQTKLQITWKNGNSQTFPFYYNLLPATRKISRWQIHLRNFFQWI